jgi:hypothetical protein
MEISHLLSAVFGNYPAVSLLAALPMRQCSLVAIHQMTADLYEGMFRGGPASTRDFVRQVDSVAFLTLGDTTASRLFRISCQSVEETRQFKPNHERLKQLARVLLLG